jgi:hypothetical protein
VKRTVTIIIATVFSMALFAGIAIADQAKFVALAKNILAPIGQDKVIVMAVKAQNKKGKSLDSIRRLDSAWESEDYIVDYMKPILHSKTADHLREIVGEHPFLFEIFVMDNQGANVAMTDKTGDYWQGDEAKFQKSFADGKGAVFVDEPEFNESFGTDVLQISVPVMSDGNTIGAITFGVFANKVM